MRIIEMIYEKLIRVIDSMENVDHVISTRKYIDLYYKSYGTKNKGLIEIYFRTRKEKFI